MSRWGTRAELEESSRRAAANYPGPNCCVVCRVLGDLKMVVPSDDLSLGPHLVLDGFWEAWVTLAVSRFVDKGMRCVDVGANLGYYSLLMGKLSGERVVAVEAVPWLASLVAVSAEMNGLDVDVRCAAAWNASGESVRVSVPRGGPYWKLYGGTSVLAERPSAGEEVETVRIDDLGLGRVDFVKIDVEGAESRVIEGMAETIERNPSIRLLLEWTPDHHEDASMIEDLLRLGFKVYLVTHDGSLRRIDLRSLPKTLEYLLLAR